MSLVHDICTYPSTSVKLFEETEKWLIVYIGKLKVQLLKSGSDEEFLNKLYLNLWLNFKEGIQKLDNLF